MEVRSFPCRQGEEELRSVGVGSAVGAAQNARPRVLQLPRDLVRELGAEDALPPSPRARGIPPLNHKVRDDSMERDVVVVARFRALEKVLCRLGRVLVVQLHRDGTYRGVERHLGRRGSGHLLRRNSVSLSLALSRG